MKMQWFLYVRRTPTMLSLGVYFAAALTGLPLRAQLAGGATARGAADWTEPAPASAPPAASPSPRATQPVRMQSLPLIPSAGQTVFGPEDFVRPRGQPSPALRIFTAQNLDVIYTVRVVNGGLEGQYPPVASAR